MYDAAAIVDDRGVADRSAVFEYNVATIAEGDGATIDDDSGAAKEEPRFVREQLVRRSSIESPAAHVGAG